MNTDTVRSTNRRLPLWPTVVASMLALVASPTPSGAQVSTISPGKQIGGALYGFTIAFSGDQLLASSHREVAPWVREGVVYAFDFDGKGWTASDVLRSDHLEAGTSFGNRLFASDERAAIRSASGIHVFRKTDSGWTEEQMIVGNDRIGAFSDAYMAVSRRMEEEPWKLHIYSRTDSIWQHAHVVAPDSTNGLATEQFSPETSMCFVGTDLVIGNAAESNFKPWGGSLRVYELGNGTFELTATIGDGLARQSGRLGAKISCSHDRFTTSNNDGLEYTTFTKQGDVWVEAHTLALPGQEGYGRIMDMTVHGSYLVLSSLPYGDETGVTRVYRDDGEGYHFVRRLESPHRVDASWELDNGCFGWSLAANGEFLVASAPFRDFMEGDDYRDNVGEVFAFGFGTIDLFPPPLPETPRFELAWSNVHPNPGRGNQTIIYNLPTPAVAQIQVFDVTGRLVSTVFDGALSEGEHTATVETSSWPPGVYFATIQLDRRKRSSQKFVVL